MAERFGDDNANARLQDLDDLLDGIAQEYAASSAPVRAGVPALSGRLYSAMTKYWPRIAAGLVGLAVVTEWVIGGITSNGALEFYVFAWATTTGGLWFMFEKAEKALSGESREKVMSWLRARDFQGSIASIPSQFLPDLNTA